jgi:lipoprotein-releasing system ATP-binding protein
LNLLGGLDKPTTGKVFFEKRDLAQMNEQELATFRNRRMGFIFQAHHLLPQCSVLENVLLPTLARGARVWPSSREAADYAKLLLDRVGLGARLQHRPGQLSGGERQRCAAARALIHKPALLLADEPTGNLDHETAQRLTELFLELQSGSKGAEGFALLVATHSSELAARMSRTVRLQSGALWHGMAST